jgi:predicted pyridoxine 5'-phosphate oxidase superfamily flavin-nucleotide-binding protein
MTAAERVINEDMRAVIESARLCFAATVTPEGRPNLSPKGTIRVWDDTHLFFLDIASPGTRANLERTPWMEINVVDQISRRGYRFFGRADLYLEGSAQYRDVMRRLYGEAEPEWQAAAIVMLAVERTAPLLSPAYWRMADEIAIRDSWRPRREELDREFEAHVMRAGPVRVDHTSDSTT